MARFRSVTTSAGPLSLGNCPSLHQEHACSEQDCFCNDVSPVACVASAWSDWDACSHQCNSGTQRRHRAVLVSQRCGGGACGTLLETRACNKHDCPVNCIVSDWTAWSDCSLSCGRGSTTRSRVVTTAVQGSGQACPALTDSTFCATAECPVDCVVTAFREWNGCSVSCGGGSVTVSVSCNAHPPTEARLARA